MPSDEVKSRIVGRDGRNIRAFETLSGVDVLLDEMEGAILLSSFDVRRRRVAELAMQRLIADGRIQPSRIKEFLSVASSEIDEAARDSLVTKLSALGIYNVPTELEQHLVTLAFRARDGQNTLEHLLECAELASIIGSELHLSNDMRQCLVRGALFHDIGKAFPASGAVSHAILGADYLRTLGEPASVINAVAAHHREVPDESILAPIVRAVDALSGGRIGARRDSLASVVSRAEELERLALQHKGVSSAYAFQGGRELQVIVLSDVVAEYELSLLAERIFEQTGGRAKVSVVRETVSTVSPIDSGKGRSS